MGVFVFHYSNGSDFGGVWLLTHFNGMFRPQYWAVREAFTGNKPQNYVPQIEAFELPVESFDSGSWVPVELELSDVENEVLKVSFSYNQRKGSRRRRNKITPLDLRGNFKEGFEIKLPKEDGAIKVYVNVKDSYNNLGIASTSIMVEDEEERAKKFKVPKVSLPFYVYKNDGDLPYYPSAYMGNYEAMEVDLNHEREKYSGTSSLMIHYKERSGWYSFAMVDPANDWGDILGGYDISGAKRFSFWAKSDFSGVRATIGFGLVKDDKPFPDSAIESIEVDLTSKWKQYSIKLKKVDLNYVRSGLVIFSQGYGSPHKIYLDNVVFE